MVDHRTEVGDLRQNKKMKLYSYAYESIFANVLFGKNTFPVNGGFFNFIQFHLYFSQYFLRPDEEAMKIKGTCSFIK